MNQKTLKIINVVAICSMFLSVAFIFILLFLGTYSEATNKPSEGLDGIGIACAGAAVVVITLFVQIVRIFAGLISITAIFPRKRIAAVVVVGVFAAILSAVAAALSAYCLIAFQSVAVKGISATSLMNTALIIAVATDLFVTVMTIIKCVSTSKQIKLEKQLDEQNKNLTTFEIGAKTTPTGEKTDDVFEDFAPTEEDRPAN